MVVPLCSPLNDQNVGIERCSNTATLASSHSSFDGLLLKVKEDETIEILYREKVQPIVQIASDE